MSVTGIPLCRSRGRNGEGRNVVILVGIVGVVVLFPTGFAGRGRIASAIAVLT
jgi:hypothetical protein